MSTQQTTTANAAMRESLTKIADLLAQHPDLPPPCVTIYGHLPEQPDLQWYLHINNKGDEAFQREAAQQIIRTIGGTWDKEPRGDRFDFTATRDDMNLQIAVKREAVCVRRVVGTETVTVPAVDAQPERTEVREVVEWDCEPVLAAVGGDA